MESILSVDPDVMHGDVCFLATRVPLTILLDNLIEGMSIDEFLRHYPTVKRSQVEAILTWEHDKLREAAGLKLAG